MSINTRLFLVSLFSIILTFSFSHTALAAAPISITISGSVTWTKAGGPYLVSSIYIPTGSSLTIEPGSVIYVSNGAYAFNVSGSLRIGAVNAERTLVTSENNITGGLPNIGDWKSILVNSGGSLTITNTNITYGGMPVSCGCGGLNPLPLIENDGGIVTLDQVPLAQMQSYGLMQTSGTTTIANSIIKDASHGAFVTGGMFELASTVFSNIGTYNAAIYAGEFVNGGGNRGGTGFFVGNIKKGSSVWVGDDVPYVIANLQIPANASLTINPGATVKIVTDAYGFFVSGELNIGASSTLPVIITSITDDTVLGDTNNDGNATVAAPGIWKTNVITPGAYAHIINTEIRYGGGFISCGCGGLTGLSLIENDGGVLLLDHAVLSRSQNDGIVQTAGTTTVMHTTFATLARSAITTQTGYMHVTENSFNDMQTGIFAYGGVLELFHNTFSSISGYGAEVYSTFINHGSNSGSAILLRQAVRTNSILSKDNIPYIVKSIYVYSGAVLTIGPGAVLKILPDAYFAIEGTLNMGSSSSTDKTIITSIKDDSILGDTNSDGSTTPLAGDWPAIRFEAGSKGTLLNTIIHYGGGTLYDSTIAGVTAFPMIKNRGGNLILDNVTLTNTGNYGIYQTSGGTTITHSEIADSVYYGVLVTGGTMSIHSTSIHNNQGYGVFNSSAANIVDATNNWWGTFGGPTHASNPFGSGDRVSDNVDYGQWLTEEPQGVCVVNCFSNVLFLPGLEASRLYRPTRIDETGTEKQLWEPTSDANVSDLFLDANGKQPSPWLNSSQIYTKDVVDEAYVTNAGPNIYKSFLEQLSKMKNTDHLIADYAAVPYDWRLSLQDILAGGTKTGDHISYISTSTDPYILSELRRLVASSRNGKVTIMAHSNGGLVAKLLLKQLEDNNDPLLAHIDKLILIASPQVGTPEALGALLFGFNQGIPANAPVFLSESTARTFAENSPGANNLLPSAKYFTLVHDSAHPLISFDNSNELSAYRSLYGQVIGNNIELQGFLMGNEGRLKPPSWNLSQPNILNSTLVHNASETHVAIDDWAPTSTIKVIEIAGWGNDTLAGLKFWMEPNFNSFGTHFRYTPDIVEDGDGTVVAPSALAMNSAPNVSRYWVNMRKYNRAGFLRSNINRDHKDILEVVNLLDFLRDNVTHNVNTDLATYLYISTSTPQVNTQEKRLHYLLHSPLSLHIYDTQGNHTGISTSTGKIEEQIPDSHYQTFGEVKYISAPASTTLHLVMNGQATGIFTLKMDEVQGDEVTASTTFLSIPSSTSSIVTLDTLAGGGIASISELHIDENGDGIIDISLIPKLNGIVTLDRTKSPLIITANNQSITLGSVIPLLSGTLSGFVNGDSATSSTVGSPSCTTTATSFSPVGTYPITCTKGSLTSSKYDFTTFASGTLTVLYKWSGFLQPINDVIYNPTLSLSVFKGGSTIPVKFQLKKADGTVVQSSTSPLWLTVQKGNAMNSLINESIFSDSATSSTAYRYDTTTQQYIYNWSTKGLLTGYWYKVFAKLEDGTTRGVVVGIR